MVVHACAPSGVRATPLGAPAHSIMPSTWTSWPLGSSRTIDARGGVEEHVARERVVAAAGDGHPDLAGGEVALPGTGGLRGLVAAQDRDRGALRLHASHRQRLRQRVERDLEAAGAEAFHGQVGGEGREAAPLHGDGVDPRLDIARGQAAFAGPAGERHGRVRRRRAHGRGHRPGVCEGGRGCRDCEHDGDRPAPDALPPPLLAAEVDAARAAAESDHGAADPRAARRAAAEKAFDPPSSDRGHAAAVPRRGHPHPLAFMRPDRRHQLMSAMPRAVRRGVSRE